MLLGCFFFSTRSSWENGRKFSCHLWGKDFVPASTVIVWDGCPLWLCFQKICGKRSWKHFPKPSFVFCVTYEYVLWGGLLPVKGKIWGSSSQQAAFAICTTNLLVRVFMKLGRGCSQNNLVHPSLSLLVKGKILKKSSWCKGREKHFKAVLGSEWLPWETHIEGALHWWRWREDLWWALGFSPAYFQMSHPTSWRIKSQETLGLLKFGFFFFLMQRAKQYVSWQWNCAAES